ncbi:MAG: ABC transporter permease [Nanoarchaeota archaeon]
MVGIFIGIAAVFTLVSLGNGFEKALIDEFEKMGTDKLFVQPGKGFFSTPGSLKNVLSDYDLELIKKVKGVETAAGMNYKIARIEFKDISKYSWVIGISTDPEEKKLLFEMQNFKVAKGRELESSDKYKILIGAQIAKGLTFDKEVDLRNTIKIDGIDFKVVGILESMGNPQDDQTMYIPLETEKEIFGEGENLDYIMAKTSFNADQDRVAADIMKTLRREKGVREGDENFNVQTSAQLIESFNTVLNIVTVALISIAAISIVVGAVGITNTMYTAVLERTGEIGIMKAIGAKNSDILTIFLIESGILGMMGGLIGVLIGVGIGKLVEVIVKTALLIDYITPEITVGLILGSLAFAFVIGAVSGTMPARQASKMHPVNALRSK